MTIDRYEVAENAYATTPGKFHVHGVSGGMTQFEEQSVTGFNTRAEADEYCAYMNDRLGWPARLMAKQEQNASRYQIRVIMASDCQSLGAVVGASDTKAGAKAEADKLGMDYYYGVAVVDIEDGVVDAGECNGAPLVFGLDEVRISEGENA